VSRILLVDDSEATRRLIGGQLRALGFEIDDAPDATRAAELALSSPPDAVVTDLWMPGISGVQLCRLLRAEPATATLPVVLLTASADRRTRFWARCAGATAYVAKGDLDELARALREALERARREGATRPPPANAPDASTRDASARYASATPRVHERLSQLLDAALYEATIAGEVRALAQHAEDPERLFAELVRVASEVLGYRWLALRGPFPPARLHASPGAAADAEEEARAALSLGDAPLAALLDDRALGNGSGASSTAPPRVLPIRLGALSLGAIAISPSGRGASREDEEALARIAAELAGALRMAALVEDTRRLASTDPLTGLMNRRSFLDALGREHSRAARHGLPMALAMVDVDHFKRVNDTHGHDVGDLVLRAVAASLADVARKSDLVARWGGEEFVVFLPQTGAAGARIAAERLRRAIAALRPVTSGGVEVPISASFGLASTSSAAPVEELLARADRALYLAKERGRNRVELG
jgi:two-component system cell cycle response regulator